jgi:phosphoglycolate phosphatase
MTASDRVIIFDTDGTLVDGRRAVLDAVARSLIATYEHFELVAPEPDRERIALAMGLPSPAFFRTAFDPKTVPGELRDVFVGEFEVQSTRAEVAALRRGESQLYPGAETTLETLRERGYALALYSNAAEPYFQTVVEVHGLDRWFSRTLSLEYAVRRRLARNKQGMVRYLAHDHAPVAVVGDRIHDIDAGRALGARTVGCRYGFGEENELVGADWRIDEVSDLLDLSCARPPAMSDDSSEARG